MEIKDDYTSIEDSLKELLDMSTIKEEFSELSLDLNEAKDFGVYNSSVYRGMFVKFCKERKIEKKEQRNLIVLSGMVNNKDRVMAALDRSKNKNMNTVKTMTSLNHFTQYVTEHRATNRFPYVKVNTTFPEIAFLGTIIQTASSYNEDVKAMKTNLPSVCKKTHVAQLDLDDELQMRHKVWEKEFWDNQVKYSRNRAFESYEPGYHEEYYAKKQGDKYKLLILPGMKMFKSPYSVETLMEYVGEVMRIFNITAQNIKEFKDIEQDTDAIGNMVNSMLTDIESLDYTVFISKYKVKKDMKKKDVKGKLADYKVLVDSGEIPDISDIIM